MKLRFVLLLGSMALLLAACSGSPTATAATPTIASLFIGEGLLLGLLAWAIAIPLSIPVGQMFVMVIGQVLGLAITYQFSWASALQWLIIMVVLSILGSAVPAIRATRVSVRESLAYE